ncbi:MAG: DUF1311 domain-containing protein [Pseudobutyrivibrio sp.]|nr:DUF1311 domain-containing protein [Pseudobutyrivibrio sp.]
MKDRKCLLMSLIMILLVFVGCKDNSDVADVKPDIIISNEIADVPAADSDNNAAMKSNKDKAKVIYDEAKKAYDKAGELAKSGITSDMVEATANQYEIADKCLNDIWAILKEELSADDYSVVLEEQRAWNKTKEDTAKQACDEYGECSFATVAYSDTLATMTMDRCLELILYLE